MPNATLLPPDPGGRVAPMLNPITRGAERMLGRAASLLWPLLQEYNRRFAAPPFQPKWAPAPLQRKRSRPTLGWPRKTDSLCPACVKEVRNAVLSGEKELSEYIDGRPGEISAEI